MPSDLIAQLEQWARERRILPQEFDCAHYQDCQDSRRRRNFSLLNRGKTCMMSYVGRDFSATYSGEPFRLVIVGMDHGESNGGDFADRQSSIDHCYYNGKDKFNPHYKGVIRTAAAILGEAGRHCLDACSEERCAGDKRLSGTRCVLRSFAQPNVVKCVSADNMTCRATSEMYGNCSDHLVCELDILKPDLAVFHGRKTALAFLGAAKNRGQEPAPFLEAPKDGDVPAVYKVKGVSFGYLALFLAHPSRGHLSRKWKTVAQPALDFLRSRGAIPP